jgi:hypothetical protein
LGSYEVAEDAIRYMINNPSNEQVLAKAYVLDSEEAEKKTQLDLRHDKPELIPLTFRILQAAKKNCSRY